MHIELYARLGFTTNDPSEKEISQAYRRITKTCHPDLFPGLKDKADLFLRITEAYEILKDTRRRQNYDKNGIITSSNEDSRICEMAMKNMSEVVLQTLENISDSQVEHTNMKQVIAYTIKVNMDNLQKEIKTRKSYIAKIEKVLSRLKSTGDTDFIRIASMRKIEEKNKELAEFGKAVMVTEKMIELLEDYEYTVPAPPQSSNTTTMSNAGTFFIKLGT
jgi:curved DNA-binding protein CbpA